MEVFRQLYYKQKKIKEKDVLTELVLQSLLRLKIFFRKLKLFTPKF